MDIIRTVDLHQDAAPVIQPLAGNLGDEDSFASLRRWNDRCLQRIVQHLADCNAPEFERCFQDAVDQLDLGAAGSEEAEALRLQLAYFRYQYCGIFDPPGAHSSAWRRVLRVVSAPAQFALGGKLRQRLLLFVMTKGDGLGYCELSPERFAQLADSVAEADRNSEYWFCCSSWAFRHEEPDFVEQAYSSLLVHPSAYLATASWLRVNLMLMLLEQRASETDVIHYLDSIRIGALLEEFNMLILSKVRSAGLLSPLVETALALCGGRVERGSLERPYESPTRKIRTGI